MTYKHTGDLLVYLFTNADNVYVYKCIDGEYIGDVNKNATSVPKKLEELCQKQVIEIKYGINFMIALTKSGRLYSWGNNQEGQLGHGVINDYQRPTIINKLINKSIAQISCGAKYCVALTRNGEVYEWGRNHANDTAITLPEHVTDLKFQTIIAISCGNYHTLALTENGEVFSWGRNGNGQLGIGYNHERHSEKPIKIDNINGDKINKICCGAYHSMLLSENGDIYTFGANNFGQIGDETSNSKNIPIKVNISTKFVDIAASGLYNNQLSIGVSVNLFYYVWGKCGENSVTKPSKTSFKSIDEVLLKHSKYKFTYKPYYFEKSYETMSPLERMQQTFNNSEFKLNDIKFKIDGKYIFVQKAFLISFCRHFETLFSNEWLESTNNEIDITQYSYSVYYSFLKYLYTESIEIERKCLIDLYHLSNSYFDENAKIKCIEIMEEMVNINNVIIYYIFAVNNDLKIFENYIINYMKTRMKDVIKTKAYIELGENSITKRILESVVNFGALA